MSKRLFLIILLMVAFGVATETQAAQPEKGIGAHFLSMPDSLLPLLTERNRQDLLDFYQNNMEAKVRNRMNSYVRLDTLTDDYLRLTLSTVSSLQMKQLQTTDSMTIVCMVRTVAAPARDSQVEFYDTAWRRLYWLELPVPRTSDYFDQAPDSVARMMEFAQRSVDDLRLVDVTIEPNQPVFTLQIATDELAEDEKKVAHRLVHHIRYRWTGNEFAPMD